ncbi:hypothetical protein IC582_031109 [Cucumis melo]
MDGIKYAVFTDKSIRLLGKNQYTSNVESGSTRTEIKHGSNLLWCQGIIAMNRYRTPGTRVEELDLLWDHTMITDV